MTKWVSALGSAFVDAVKGAHQKLAQTFDVSAQIDQLFDNVSFFGLDGAGCAEVNDVDYLDRDDSVSSPQLV